MPTPYLSLTEERALEEYRKKLEETEGIVHYARIRPPGPDALFKIERGGSVWVEVSSVFDGEQGAEFLNKHGLRNSEEDPIVSRSIVLGEFSEYLLQMLKKIEERIQAKDSKSSIQEYLKKFGQGVLILYIDNPFFSDIELNKICEANAFSGNKLKYFHAVFLYIPSTDVISVKGISRIGGFYSLLERKSLFPAKGEIFIFQTEAGQTQIEVRM